MNSQLQALAVVNDFTDLILAMKARRHALNISQLQLDDLTGLPDGYTGKVELSATNPGAKNARSLGRVSMAEMLRALNLKLVLVDDGSADHLRRVPAPRPSEPPTMIAPLPVRDARSLMAERARKAGKASWKAKTPEEWKEFSRRGGLARWQKHRELMKKTPLKRTKPKTEGN